MDELRAYLQAQAQAQGDLLPWSAQAAAAERFGIPVSQVERVSLEAGLLPARYQRNRKIISTAGQLTLFQSCVAVIGCGGLGGHIVEQLARLGVGRILAIDPDVFEEHNLNRQLLSSIEGLGQAKVTAARDRVARINPAVTLVPTQVAFGRTNGTHLLREATLVVDALDSIPVRLELAQVCQELDIPLVHGAIAGWYGHVATQFPGETSVQEIYRSFVAGKGVEQQLGNPSFTPAVVASLEVAEACKILLNEGQPLRGRKLAVDLLDMEFHDITLEQQTG